MSRTYIQNKMTEVKLGEILQVKNGWAFKGEY